MKGARQIGWVSGIPIRVHWSFFLVIAWSAHIGYQAGGAPAILFSITLTLILFACVFLHELGHALAARKFGVRTRSITLLPIGGVAALERIPERPFEELVIALAGPMVNIVIAGLLFAWSGWPEVILTYGPQWDFHHLLEMVLFVNVFMVVFNMIPAFPMDGGRVLRACLASVISFPRATAIAAAIGQALAVAMIVFGLGTNPFLSLIGIMVFLGARVETRAVQLRSALTGLKVKDIMTKPPPIVDPGDPLTRCLDAWHESGTADFLVMQNQKVEGILSAVTWRKYLLDPGNTRVCATVMERPVVMIKPGMPLVALCDLVRSGSQRVYPVMEAGLPVGLVTRYQVVGIMASGIRPAVPHQEEPGLPLRSAPRSWLDVG